MTIVAELLTLCLKDIGIVGEGQTASPDALQDAFETLKQMLGQWQADRLYVYASKEAAVTLTGAASYSVGPGGAVNIVRPVKIDAAYLRAGGSNRPVALAASLNDFMRGILASADGATPLVFYSPLYPLATLHVFPSSATGDLRLVTRIDLPTYADTYDDLALPPEYAMAIRYSLDELLSISFAAPLRPDIPAAALKARKIMKRNNVTIPLSQMPAHLPGRC